APLWGRLRADPRRPGRPGAPAAQGPAGRHAGATDVGLAGRPLERSRGAGRGARWSALARRRGKGARLQPPPPEPAADARRGERRRRRPLAPAPRPRRPAERLPEGGEGRAFEPALAPEVGLVAIVFSPIFPIGARVDFTCQRPEFVLDMF